MMYMSRCSMLFQCYRLDVIVLLVVALCTCALVPAMLPLNLNEHSHLRNLHKQLNLASPSPKQQQQQQQHKLCLITAFKGLQGSDGEGEADEIALFVKHLSRFLKRMRITGKQPALPDEVQVIVVRQSTANGLLFNRGALLNAGARIASACACTYIAVHDVDLLPVDERVSYEPPPPGVFRHLCPPGLHPVYVYKRFFGGAFVANIADFFNADGFSPNYWGWVRCLLLFSPYSSLALRHTR